MKKHPAHIDPDLPAGLGDMLGNVIHSEEFLVPDDYFIHSKSEIILKSLRTGNVADDDFFERQSVLIRLKTLKKESHEELLVPDGYFDKGISLPAGSSDKIRVINLRWITIPAAAAAVIIAFWFLRPGNEKASEFAALLEQADLDLEDLEYFAETDDLAALYLDSYGDTLIIDSTSVSIDLVHDSLIFQEFRTVASDSLTIPEKKPKNQTPVSFDELTEEEILEFLLEEGGDDLFEDL